MYTANIGETLANEIPAELWEAPKTAHPPTFSFTNVLSSRVQELINDLNCSKACGLDGITTRIIKDAGPVLTPILTYIFNLSLEKERFPQAWKTSLISPIFKDGERSSPSDY